MLFLDLTDYRNPSLEQVCATIYYATEAGVSYIESDQLTSLIAYPSYLSKEGAVKRSSESPLIASIKKTIKTNLKFYRQTNQPQYIKSKNRLYYILQTHRDPYDKLGFFLLGPFFLHSKRQSQLHYSHYITDYSKPEYPDLQHLYYKIPIISSRRYHELGMLLTLILRKDMDYESPLPDMPDTSDESQPSLPHYPYAMEKALCEAVLDYDKEKIKEYTTKLAEYPIACLSQEDPLRSLKNNFIAGCTVFTRLAIDAGLPEETAFSISDTFIRDVEKCISFHAIKKTYSRLLMMFTESIRNNAIKGYSSIVRNGIRYILSHIKDDNETLSLTRIADHVGVHPNYFSKRFSQETGMQVSRYIRRAKVEEAKKLLENTKESIIDIACCQLKFNNQSYFSKVFKEESSLTPAQYRNQCIKTT